MDETPTGMVELREYCEEVIVARVRRRYAVGGVCKTAGSCVSLMFAMKIDDEARVYRPLIPLHRAVAGGRIHGSLSSNLSAKVTELCLRTQEQASAHPSRNVGVSA